ncbi:sulfite exporter TauE/SafE family protein [Nocardioides sp.]|uniref:sulfite exporter TauE/SafE family protein n=1 Tax=Nocardioides sp. TaxID=35761 RepID=UPI00273749B1|nr:sulfite exporter TauE/SafE family protein [Nocardioides sp.]MDP3890663.1 sulfite exporter TauE/SafE family protein [Nocardioides sp.]
MTLVLLAIAAGLLIGLSLGALGGGGSILAVPVLVYALGQSPVQATTGSLVVVGVTALIGAAVAVRTGNVLVGRGVVFGLVAVAGAVAGARASVGIDEDLLLAAFGVLMLVVAASMGIRLLRSGRRSTATAPAQLDDPIITFSPVFACQCPRALKVLVAATAVGLLTGFLGVGGGFLVVPALVLALGLPVRYAAGTSLVVITLTSAAALAVRVGSGVQPDWGIVAVLTVVAALAGAGGSLLAARLDPRRLSITFTMLVLLVAVGTAGQAVPALV